MMMGHQFLLQEFGVRPRIGWQVDPFGHSNANPRLFADMGFDAWFFGRLDFQDKEKRESDKGKEFIWQPFVDHLGNRAQIYSHVIENGYCYFDGFAYDDREFSDEIDTPVVSNPDLETFNADFKADLMQAYILEMLDLYQGNHLFVSQGCDFTFGNANMNFMSLDRLIKYFNALNGTNATLVWSTPGIYLDAIKKQNLTYPIKTDDMFPYADQANDYWTGYFTSRPAAKGQVRDGQANLHASNKVYALKALKQNVSAEDIQAIKTAYHSMMDAMGIYQHHDAITGTAKQHVAEDYYYRLDKSIKADNYPVYAKAVQDVFVSTLTKVKTAKWEWCANRNGTYFDCPVVASQSSDFLIAVHNPASIPQKYLTAKVPHGQYEVMQWDGAKNAFVAVPKAAVICYQRYAIVNNTEEYVNDCTLHVKTLVSANGFALVKLQYNKTKNLVQPVSPTNAVSGGGETLIY